MVMDDIAEDCFNLDLTDEDALSEAECVLGRELTEDESIVLLGILHDMQDGTYPWAHDPDEDEAYVSEPTRSAVIDLATTDAASGVRRGIDSLLGWFDVHPRLAPSHEAFQLYWLIHSRAVTK